MAKVSQYPIDSDFIVRISSAPCKGQFGDYRHIAVLEVDPGIESASMISEHARGVRSIVRSTGRVPFGKTERSEGRQELAACRAFAARLNAAQSRRRKAAATRQAAEALASAQMQDALALAT